MKCLRAVLVPVVNREASSSMVLGRELVVGVRGKETVASSWRLLWSSALRLEASTNVAWEGEVTLRPRGALRSDKRLRNLSSQPPLLSCDECGTCLWLEGCRSQSLDCPAGPVGTAAVAPSLKDVGWAHEKFPAGLAAADS